jgi:hypothetical protein
VFTELTCVISSVHSTDIIQPIMFLLAWSLRIWSAFLTAWFEWIESRHYTL